MALQLLLLSFSARLVIGGAADNTWFLDKFEHDNDLGFIVLEYASVVDPVNVLDDAFRGQSLLRRASRYLHEVCPVSDGTDKVFPRVVAPRGLLADAVHSAYLGRIRALKARLHAKNSRTIALRQVDDFGHWIHRLFNTVLEMTTQKDAEAAGGMGHTAVQLAAAYLDHVALTALLRRGLPCEGVGAPGQLTAREFAARNCDSEAVRILTHYCDGPAPKLSVECFDLRGGSAAGTVSVSDAAVAAAQLKAWETTDPIATGWRRSLDDGPGWQPGNPDPEGLPRCTRVLPTVAADAIDPTFWAPFFAAAASPLVMLNGTTHWQLPRTFRKTFLETSRLRDVDLVVSQIPYGEHYNFTSGLASIGELLQYLDRRQTPGDQEPPLYAFDADALRTTFGGEYALPPGINASFRGWGLQAHQLAIGPEGSGSPFHFHEDAINALLYGRKMWDLVPPSETLFSIDHHWCPGAPGGAGQARCVQPPPRGVRCVQLPGDMIYVPRRWGHSTLNLAESVAIAVESDGTTCLHQACDLKVV
eukprot:m.463001 g.463001  ORF g.463001 m.463001 type:complete len:531 (+) comp22864_c0_seq1:74-1666(+)